MYVKISTLVCKPNKTWKNKSNGLKLKIDYISNITDYVPLSVVRQFQFGYHQLLVKCAPSRV